VVPQSISHNDERESEYDVYHDDEIERVSVEIRGMEGGVSND
jgi:hypothetical protein